MNFFRELFGGTMRSGSRASQYARSLIEASLDPLVTISPEGKITDVNEATIKVTGVFRERLDQRWTADPEEKKRILRERAKVLARGPGEKEPEEHVEVLEFLLANERYALETFHIHEVCVLKEITPLPGTPSFVNGIINLRGKVLSVIDLKKFFDLPKKGLGDLNKVIVLSSAGMEFGVLADAILGIRKIPLSELQPSLPTLTGIRKDYLTGVTHDRLVVLDAGKLLSDKRLLVHEEA